MKAVVSLLILFAAILLGQNSSVPQELGRRDGGPGMPSAGSGGAGGPFPILSLLDRDGNGEFSRGEIDGASGILRMLDRNGDGRISNDEMPFR